MPFLFDPNDRLRKKKFEQFFGIPYEEGTTTKYKLDITPIHKLASQGISLPYGVLAAEHIPKEEIVSEYTGLLHKNTNTPSDTSYVYNILPRTHIDARTKGSVGRFFNHSDNNNCSFVVHDGRVYIKTNREINTGEQLTVNYGPHYFNKNIQRIYLDAHHTDQSPQQIFDLQRNNYVKCSSLKNSSLKKTIKELLGESPEEDIYVPLMNKPNLPIVLLKKQVVQEHIPEVTFFHALCMSQDNNENIAKALDQGADCNIQCSSGRNALFYVVSGQETDEQKAARITLLFQQIKNKEEGILSFNTDCNFTTVYHYCLQHHLNNSIAALLENVYFHEQYFDDAVESPIITAIKADNVEGLKLVLSKSLINDLKKFINPDEMAINLARLPEIRRIEFYTVFSSFMNIGSLANKVQSLIPQPQVVRGRKIHLVRPEERVRVSARISIRNDVVMQDPDFISSPLGDKRKTHSRNQNTFFKKTKKDKDETTTTRPTDSKLSL
jgi:hypothetical protein